MTETYQTIPTRQRVIIGGLSHGKASFEYTMTELTELARADNLEVVDRVTQNLDRVDAATYFGSGKVNEIKELAQGLDVSTIIINDELSPSQLANLEKRTGLHFVDRTELILEIFADRAHTREAKAQVEIARLQYALPRIHPSANTLDQQRGGGGLMNRGAGETKSELNRRTIRKRISDLKQQLAAMTKTEQTKRERRRNSALPQVALVGYTNAGKSTTLNQLLEVFSGTAGSKKQVFEKNMLFATLDTSVREIQLPTNQRFLMSDTVGFVSNLPHNLIESFKTTLAEAAQADLLIQVVDYSDPNYQEMMVTTAQTLQEIGISDMPMIYAFNKADLKGDTKFPELDGHDITYSAKDPDSIKLLAKLITSIIFADYQTVNLLLPFDRAKDVAELEASANVHQKDYTETGTQLNVTLSPTQLKEYAAFQVDPVQP
ncbi:GTPase HflX [Lapidilactobacillus salsurivasis]